MEVRAYVTEPQLSSIRLGQEARVSVDAGGGQRQTVSGTISWISSRAEFTPTPIQTREERVDMVYAIKIRVANDNGVLKIGMPVDVQFVGEPGRAMTLVVQRPSSSISSRNGSGRPWRSTACRSRSRRRSCSASSAPTAAARPRCSGSSRPC